MRPHEIVRHANRIAEEYRDQGLTLTLRQMYYRFVATGLIENGQKAYKRIGSALTDARYAGRFPVDAIEDRGRSLSGGSHNDLNLDVRDALERAHADLRSAPYYLRAGRWHDQPRHVSVWVEKEALAGVFAPVCAELGLSFLACKGYPSVSVLYDFATELRDVETAGTVEHVVLYFGDHDPDGLEIPAAAARSVKRLCDLRGREDEDEDEDVNDDGDLEDDNVDEEERVALEFGGTDDTVIHAPSWLRCPVRFRRAALNIDQIRAFNPPPFPAKETSARFTSYVRKTGLTEAWELDALEPRALRDLIRREAGRLYDPAVARGNDARVRAAREEMRGVMRTTEWQEAAFAESDL